MCLDPQRLEKKIIVRNKTGKKIYKCNKIIDFYHHLSLTEFEILLYFDSFCYVGNVLLKNL